MSSSEGPKNRGREREAVRERRADCDFTPHQLYMGLGSDYHWVHVAWSFSSPALFKKGFLGCQLDGLSSQFSNFSRLLRVSWLVAVDKMRLANVVLFVVYTGTQYRTMSAISRRSWSGC